MHRILVALLFFPFFSLYGADTTAVIHGRVFDNATGEPLLAANVIYGKNQGVTTDVNGYYRILTGPGNVTITFLYVGYRQVTKSLFLRSGDTTELNAGLEQEIREIDQIVVSAGKTEQKISDLTVSMSVIKPLQISKTHITDAQELINKTSGIEIMDGQASIRGGSGYSYGVGSRVLTLIDGLPVLSADAGNVKWHFLPLENISQVEIIKGASSVLYGSSALNGIINFRTAGPGNIPETRFFAETGIYDKPKRKEWKWWDRPQIFSSASFSHLRKSGNTDFGVGGTLILDNGYRRLNEENLGRINFSVRHHNKKIEGLNYGINLNGGITSKTDFLLWENADSGALKQNPGTALGFRGDFFALDPFINFRKTDKYKHELKMRLQSTHNKIPEKEENNSNALSLYAEYQFWYKMSRILNVNLGISENYSIINSNFHGDHEGLNIACFTQLEIKPVERLKMIAGLRLEQNSLDGIKDELVPIFRTGINYHISGYTFLRASFGQGYRYPSIAEKYASTTVGSIVIIPNTLIKPEKGWGSEIGIKQGIIKGKLNGQADLSFFYSQNKDLIEYLFASYEYPPGSGTYVIGFKATNVEQSRVYGYELECTLNNTFGRFNTTFTGGYIYMYPVEFNEYTRKNTDIFLKYRRKHSAKLGIEAGYKKIELALNVFAKSRILSIDDVFLDESTRESFLPGFYEYWTNDNKGFILADTYLRYYINDRYMLSFSVKNITNTEYMGRPGDIQPQRNFSLRFAGKI